MTDNERNENRAPNIFHIVEILKRFRMFEHDIFETVDSESSNKLVEILCNKALEHIENTESDDLLDLSQFSIDDKTDRKLTFPKPGTGSQYFEVSESKLGISKEITILQQAVENYSEKDSLVKSSLKLLIESLIDKCPKLIVEENENGVSPLISVTLMQVTDLLKVMLKKLSENQYQQLPVNGKINSVCSAARRGRILSADSIYHVAALTLNQKIFGLFLTSFGNECVRSTGKFDDNVLHALVRYGSKSQSREDVSRIIDMLKYLQDCKYRGAIQPLWRMTNEDGLTPLQLAANKGQHEIFAYIMSLEMLYYIKDGDEDCFDVTEIDTVPHGDNNETITNDQRENKAKDRVHKPVLHLIRYVSDKYGVPIANMPAVKAVIDIKWKSYRWFIWIWFVIHLVVMGLCTWYAVIRAQLTNPFVEDKSNKVDRAYGLGACVLGYGILCLVMQIVRNVNKLRRKRYQKFHLRYMTSSFMFPWFFGLVGLLIVLDFVLATTLDTYINFLLPYILIFGWGLSLYFLQVFNYFSVFVVMIQRLSAIMIQFAIVTGFFLVGFSAAAYLALHNVKLEDDDDTFKHFGKTVFKMLTIMIGLGDIDVVLDAEYLIMTISIFVMFALLTTILLLNALIAYMSEICSLIAEYGERGSISSKVYARLVKVTVIVQLEDFLPVFLMKMGETDDALLTSLPYRDRKYVTLRSSKDPQADQPLEIDEENDEKNKKSNMNPLSDNKVLPSKRKTLEITEITQSYCTHDCTCCDIDGTITTRSIR